MTIWDVGGQDKIRSLWKHYFENTDALVFLVDSNDDMRMREAREELHRVADSIGLSNAVVLILANKQDLPNAIRPDKMVEHLDLRTLRNEWYLQPCSAVSGDGLHEGLEWVGNAIRSKGAPSKSHSQRLLGWDAAVGWSAAAA